MTKRRLLVVVAAGAVAVGGAGLVAAPATPGAWAVPAAGGAAVPSGAVRAAGSWGRAIEVPGLAALNQGGDSQVAWLSCTSAGNCAAGGYYRDGHQNRQGFVAREEKGVWDRAIEVPGLAALNRGQDAQVFSVSCASAGNCVAGGYYRNHGYQGFVAVEKNGRWGRAIEVPGLAALNQGGNAQVLSVSCGSRGTCVAGGYYRDQDRKSQGFAVVERNGSWRKAIEVPGLGALNRSGKAQVVSVSCASTGSCAAGGSYTDGGRHSQGFVAGERNGSWWKAIEVPGLGALNTGGGARISEVSCATAGNCAAGGSYTDGGRHFQGFVASEKNGRWGQAIEVPGLGTLGPDASVDDVSCATAGNCAAGGGYVDSSGSYQGFVASQTNGRWGRATTVPGLEALNTQGSAAVWAVSCPSPGNCAAGGWYQVPYENLAFTEPFVAVETNGRWGRAIEVPGLGAMNNFGNAGVLSVSCASPGNCAAGGFDADAQGFVVTEKTR